MKTSSFVFLICISLCIQSCDHEPPVGPPVGRSDTTSHNFVLNTEIFGDGNASVLYGVAIINDSLAYAVGEIYLKDSTGGFDPLPYNFAKWDGTSWQLTRVAVQTKYSLATAPFYGICVFSSDDIWILLGTPVHWDGNKWTQYDLYDMGVLGQSDGDIRKAWGENSRDMYFVGNLGTIVHYTGSGWQKLISGTRTGINDVWGITDRLGRDYVYCTVTNYLEPADKKILEISYYNKVDSLNWTLVRAVSSVWTNDTSKLYVCGDGVFERSGGAWQEMKTGASIGTTGIRGNSVNDIFVIGGFGFIAHYNGSTWQIYPPSLDGQYNSVAVRGNLCIAVCTTGDKAVITIGKR